MINAEWFQLNQISLFVFLVALVGVIRERKLLVFFIVILGSFLHGDVMAALIAAMILWYRSHIGVSRALKVKDTLSLFFLVAGSALPSPFREFMICFGVLGISVQMQQDSLSVVPALLMTHLYFGEEIPIEIVLSSAGFLILLKEILILAKTEKKKRILQWLEVPVLVGVLFPFKNYVLKLFEDPVFVVMAPSFVVLILALVLWILLKKPNLREVYSTIQRNGLGWFRWSAEALPIQAKWIQIESSEENIGIQKYSETVFWGTLTVLITWFVLVLIFKGGLG